MADRTRVGVVGCGLIAQVMHLPYLTELSDDFEVAALCDIRETVAAGCAERFGVPRVLTRWEDLLEEPLDAVLIATSGDHAPIAIEAARAGLHVLVEKPMALSSAGAEEMSRAAERAGVCLMVGTMKRYDPAYERLAELLPSLEDLRLIRVTTLESPFAPYVAHYPLIGLDGPVADPVVGEHERDALDAALGDVDEETRWCYRWILLDNLVHEFNMLGGLLGAPDEIRFAHLSRRSVAVDMRFGAAECHLSWVDLPGVARYRQEVCLYGPAQRLTLELPSPFLRSMPSRLTVRPPRLWNVPDDGADATSGLWQLQPWPAAAGSVGRAGDSGESGWSRGARANHRRDVLNASRRSIPDGRDELRSSQVHSTSRPEDRALRDGLRCVTGCVA